MAPVIRGYSSGMASDSYKDSDASYDLAEDTMPPTSSCSSKANGKAMRSNNFISLSDDNVVTDPSGEQKADEEQYSILPSWISKISGIPAYRLSGTAKHSGFLETQWLQSAEQTTGDSDVESVLSIDSGLGSLESQADEDFTDLQADATLQSASSELQTQVKKMQQILDAIHLCNESAVPRDIRVRLREHARVIAYIFGDDVGELKRRIKGQKFEIEKIIQKHAAEFARTNTTNSEMIVKLKKKKDEEIKSMHEHHRSEIQKIRNQYNDFEQRHQRQIALCKQKIGQLAVDYPAFHALKEQHEKLKQQLGAATAQISALESQVPQWQNSQVSQDRNQVLEMENATLKDRVAQVKAQLEHTQTGHKCTRDALAQLNEELKLLNESKGKVNCALHQSLVTSWTQVERLSQNSKQEQGSPKNASETPWAHDEARPAGGRSCPDHLAAKLELSDFRNLMAIDCKEKRDIKEELVKSRRDNAELEKQHKQLELQLHVAQFQLHGTTQRQDAATAEVRRLSKQLITLQNELETAKATLDEEDVDAKKTQRQCLVLVRQQADLKMRAEAAEKGVREEKEKYERLWEKVRKNVEELVKKTGGLGSSSREILGIVDELDGSSA